MLLVAAVAAVAAGQEPNKFWNCDRVGGGVHAYGAAVVVCWQASMHAKHRDASPAGGSVHGPQCPVWGCWPAILDRGPAAPSQPSGAVCL